MTIQPQLTIRPATTADLPAIMKLVESAIEIMHNNGNTGQYYRHLLSSSLGRQACRFVRPKTRSRPYIF